MANCAVQQVQRVTRKSYRLADLLRDKQAFQVAIQGAVRGDFSAFAGVRQCLLVTFNRLGAAVPSPMNFGMADGKIYMRTEGGSAKVKRLRNNPRVVIAPSTFRGKPRAAPVAATARILPDSEVERADAIIAANWTLVMKLGERTLDHTTHRFDMPPVYIEFTPDIDE
jgi:PPOX class probable F420-dependent enzyme